MKVPVFMKTIRFRLSVWYAALLVILAVLIVLWINLGFRYAGDLGPRLPGTPMDREEMMRAFQSESEQRILIISIISAAGTLVVGAIGGYLLSGRLLKPVDKVLVTFKGLDLVSSLFQGIDDSAYGGQSVLLPIGLAKEVDHLLGFTIVDNGDLHGSVCPLCTVFQEPVRRSNGRILRLNTKKSHTNFKLRHQLINY